MTHNLRLIIAIALIYGIASGTYEFAHPLLLAAWGRGAF